jgi:hypothetical protein
MPGGGGRVERVTSRALRGAGDAADGLAADGLRAARRRLEALRRRQDLLRSGSLTLEDLEDRHVEEVDVAEGLEFYP